MQDPIRKVVGVGLACVDQLLLWQDVKASVADGKVLEMDMQGGGMVGTGLTAVRRLGGQAEFWGVVGDDWLGGQVVQGLQKEGIDVSQVRVMPGGCGPFVLVCVDKGTGERYFRHWKGCGEPEQPLGDLGRLRGAGCLLLDGSHPATALRAAEEARRLGVPTVGDVGWMNPRVRGLIGQMDYAIASEGCMRALGFADDYREACRAIRGMGAACAVITRGANGLIAYDGRDFLELTAFPVEVVDTTGAGDVFHGAFCYGLVWGLRLEANLTFASAVAALKCRRIGGRAGIPTRDEALAFLRERGVELPAANAQP